MFKLKGFKLGAALFMLSSTVNAAIIIDSQQIPSEDIVSITISPTTGNMFITTSVGYDVTPSDGTVAPPPPTDVAILSFNASPSTLVAGGNTRLTWTTQNAVSCAPTGGGSTSWNNQNTSIAGFADIDVDTAGNYAFTLTCQDAAGTRVVRNKTVVVTAAPGPTVTTCAASPLSGQTTTWGNFWGIAFPLPGYSNTSDSIPRRGYVAYKFNTGDIVDSGLIVTVGNTFTSGTRTGSISECAGDFKVSNACSHIWGIGGGITWATDGKSGACALKANTDYFLNITFTNGLDSNTSTCTSSTCIAKIQHVNR